MILKKYHFKCYYKVCAKRSLKENAAGYKNWRGCSRHRPRLGVVFFWLACVPRITSHVSRESLTLLPGGRPTNGRQAGILVSVRGAADCFPHTVARAIAAG